MSKHLQSIKKELLKLYRELYKLGNKDEDYYKAIELNNKIDKLEMELKTLEGTK